jgi:ribosome-associated protein YbcJ (S4-like RNA binding protein)
MEIDSIDVNVDIENRKGPKLSFKEKKVEIVGQTIEEITYKELKCPNPTALIK